MGEKNMSMPLIDPLPPAPTPADPEDVFDEKAYETVAALAPFVEQTNTLALAVEAEATRSESEADRSQAQVNAATTEANRAQAEAERAKDEADRAEQARDDAVVVVTDGQGSLTPAPGKFPVAGSTGTIKQDWIENLQFELDALHVARNKLMYGDGPYPVLDLQFVGAKKLDPRVVFTRSTPDWDEDGNRYEVNEPVITNKGLWLSEARTNLWPYATSLSPTSPNTVRGGELSIAEGTGRFARGVTLSITGGVDSYYYIAQPGTEFSDRHTFTAYISVEDGGKPNIGQESGNSSLDASFLAAGTLSETTLNLVTSIEHSLGNIWKFTATFNRPESPSRNVGFLKRASNSSRSFTIWAIQIEKGEVATPLIPTGGSQVSVAPSNFSIPSAGINELSVFIDFVAYTSGTIFSTGTNVNNSLRPSVTSSPTRINAIAQNSSLAVPNTNNPLEKRWKMGVSVDSESTSAVVNGGEVVNRALTTSADWAASPLTLGKFSFQNSSYITGHFKSFSMYDKPLTNEQLQELTS